MADTRATNGAEANDGQQKGTSEEPLRIGISGLGRSGWGIHANVLAQIGEKFSVTAVCDPDPARQEEAVDRFDCLAYSTIDEIIADKAVELLVVATPSQLHVSDASAAMRAGKHVIVEKPMAPTLAGVDEMIAVAEETGMLLTVNQNYRYHADFLKVKEVVDSGVLGRIVQMRITGNGFRRRWDWQTLKKYGGGDLNNKGRPFDRLGDSLFRRSEPGDLLPDGDDAAVCGGCGEPREAGHQAERRACHRRGDDELLRVSAGRVAGDGNAGDARQRGQAHGQLEVFRSGGGAAAGAGHDADAGPELQQRNASLERGDFHARVQLLHGHVQSL